MPPIRRRNVGKDASIPLRGGRSYIRKGPRDRFGDSDDAGTSLRSDIPRKDIRVPGQKDRPLASQDKRRRGLNTEKPKPGVRRR